MIGDAAVTDAGEVGLVLGVEQASANAVAAAVDRVPVAPCRAGDAGRDVTAGPKDGDGTRPVARAGIAKNGSDRRTRRLATQEVE